jgi:hypothetical protein
MSLNVDRIVATLGDVEGTLKRDIRAERRRFRYRVRRGRVWFDEEAGRAHRRLRQSLPAYFRDARLVNLLTPPIVYSVALPFLLLDLWVTVYQWICFPIFGIARVPRRSYFAIDRHKLAYLNAIEKVHCAYCSYATGVISYVREVAARTEQYWCPIKHARRIRGPHQRYRRFLDYGDANAYRRDLKVMRGALPVVHPRVPRRHTYLQ